MPTGKSFEEGWPELALLLQRMLRSKGLDPSTAEDVIQETGLRLFRMWDQVDPSRPLVPLAATIAFNLMRDEFRERHRHAFSEIPELSSAEDVERSTIARLDLHRAARAMRSLSPSYRDALLGDVVEDRVGPLPPSIKMARMRARRKLSALLGTASSLWAWFARRIDGYVQPAAGALLAVTIVTAGGNIGPPRLGPSGVTNDRPGPRVEVVVPTADRPDPEPSHGRPRPARRSLDVLALARETPDTRPRRPVRVPLAGAGEARFAARIEAGNVIIEVGDSGGPVPVCVSGIGPEPDNLDCEEAPSDA